MLCTKEIIVRGKVQRVFFRKYCLEAALNIGITGFVKNQPDQSVYILATGTNEQLNQFINWCWQGSPGSNVEGVDIRAMDLQVFTSFTIER